MSSLCHSPCRLASIHCERHCHSTGTNAKQSLYHRVAVPLSVRSLLHTRHPRCKNHHRGIPYLNPSKDRQTARESIPKCQRICVSQNDSHYVSNRSPMPCLITTRSILKARPDVCHSHGQNRFRLFGRLKHLALSPRPLQPHMLFYNSNLAVGFWETTVLSLRRPPVLCPNSRGQCLARVLDLIHTALHQRDLLRRPQPLRPQGPQSRVRLRA